MAKIVGWMTQHKEEKGIINELANIKYETLLLLLS